MPAGKEVNSAVEERIGKRFDDETEVQNTFLMNKYIPAYNMVVETLSNTELFGKLCFLRIVYLSRLVGKPTMWFPNRSDTNRAVQSQKRARDWKFWI